jgi:hypothetical protein
VGKLEGRRLLGKLRYKQEDNIKMDLREMGVGSMNWIDLVQDEDQWRVLVNTVMSNEPSGSMKYCEIVE